MIRAVRPLHCEHRQMMAKESRQILDPWMGTILSSGPVKGARKLERTHKMWEWRDFLTLWGWMKRWFQPRRRLLRIWRLDCVTTDRRLFYWRLRQISATLKYRCSVVCLFLLYRSYPHSIFTFCFYFLVFFCTFSIIFCNHSLWTSFT